MQLAQTLGLPSLLKIPDGPVKEYLRKLHTALESQHRQVHNDINTKFIYNLKSGATQAAAGAAKGEMWYTSGHASLPDNVLMLGV